MKRSLQHSISRKQSGATMVEFTLAFPIIVLLIVFLIDAGLYLFQRDLLTDGTAALNRQIVTRLGQREAAAAAPIAPGPAVSCTNLKDDAITLRIQMTDVDSPVLYKDMSFELNVVNTLSTPYRLVISEGAFAFKCLTCKFFPMSLIMRHKSVLVIERPKYPSLTCTDFTASELSGVSCLNASCPNNSHS